MTYGVDTEEIGSHAYQGGRAYAHFASGMEGARVKPFIGHLQVWLARQRRALHLTHVPMQLARMAGAQAELPLVAKGGACEMAPHTLVGASPSFPS